MMDSYQEYIHKSRYARWREEDNRRETWQETVQRYVDFFEVRGQINEKESKMLYDAIYNLDVMPSMRCLMTAGKALDRDNMAGFNCSYIAIDHIRAFDEILNSPIYKNYVISEDGKTSGIVVYLKEDKKLKNYIKINIFIFKSFKLFKNSD